MLPGHDLAALPGALPPQSYRLLVGRKQTAGASGARNILEAPSLKDARESLEQVTAALQENVPVALEVLKDGFEHASRSYRFL